MKKIIIISLITCLGLSFVGCNERKQVEQEKDNIEYDNIEPAKEAILLPDKDSIVYKDIDLRTIADKIIAEFPPEEGVELTYDTENIDVVFNKSTDDDEHFDTKNIHKFLRVYNANSEKMEESYDIILVDFFNEEQIQKGEMWSIVTQGTHKNMCTFLNQSYYNKIFDNIEDMSNETINKIGFSPIHFHNDRYGFCGIAVDEDIVKQILEEIFGCEILL